MNYNYFTTGSLIVLHSSNYFTTGPLIVQHSFTTFTTLARRQFSGQPLAVRPLCYTNSVRPSVCLSVWNPCDLWPHLWTDWNNLGVAGKPQNSCFRKSKFCPYGPPLTPPNLGFQHRRSSHRRRQWHFLFVMLCTQCLILFYSRRRSR